MADKKISELNAKATLHDTDLVPIVDVEATPDETKHITGANLKSQAVAGHAGTEAAGIHGSTDAATASKLVHRDASARAKFAAPDAAGDALIKGTRVAIAELPAITAGNVWMGEAVTNDPIEHSPESTAGANKLIKRDASGRARVADPSDNADIDTQGARDTAIGTHAALTTGVHGAGANTLWHGGSLDVVNRTHLSQVFGPSSKRLANIILEAKEGACLHIDNTRSGPFTALINGAPSTTSVVYDGDTNEDMFKELKSGAGYWGRIILHNTTRGNSRKVVSVNRTTNTITTESSTDDWADNDSLTTSSQVCTGTNQFYDVDLSASIPTSVIAILCSLKIGDNSAGNQANRTLILHPYEATDWGKIAFVEAAAANQTDCGAFWMPMLGQKMCIWMRNATDVSIYWTVSATAEYADAES